VTAVWVVESCTWSVPAVAAAMVPVTPMPAAVPEPDPVPVDVELVELEVGVVAVDEHPVRNSVPAASAATTIPVRERADVEGLRMRFLSWL
jgi:hypothetical protein